MAYKMISPATDWFFVVYPVAPRNELTVWRLATWALNEEGNVIGLVSALGGGQDDNVMGATCKLIPIPPLSGIYKHASELTADEAEAANSCKPVKVTPAVAEVN